MSDHRTILLTPGPLTTSQKTRDAMGKDWGSRDSQFNSMMATIRQTLVKIIHGEESHVCIPLQGSGTFAVEAALGTFIPADGTVLTLINGAYGKRIAQICQIIGRKTIPLQSPESHPTCANEVEALLDKHPEITHVTLVHCETSVGIINPLNDIAQIVATKGRRLLVDAMSSFGALPIDVRQAPCDAVIAASGKCLEGVPGMGFVLAHKATLLDCKNQAHSLVLDLYDQYCNMEATGQWRFTPPTHVVAAFHEALAQFSEQGGQPQRLARYEKNYQTLARGLDKIGLKRYIPEEIQSPVIVTFHAPRDPRYQFNEFYNRVREKGFVLYPGKLTKLETFRVGCIGDVSPNEMQNAVDAIIDTFNEMGIREM
ncbi:2-aminoethylphosphonate--pyruvate transaminase [Salmonella enterica subsp. enterica]|nr:2-aminoethylphosphonate--pyruvate transaminase [Salmonella enterica]EBY0806485.1 2-aminoethylphosphonate--pyruvate transaminase [Salmonella enterica subsp. enterica serovar Berlin]ECF3780252.1 2-aminoethylphosphonate--pyruvate transaminase [Salmonella enterica subsp. enterica serovar Oslo]EDR2105137.1 2-aminoethylphosphonate--pyruvate transaminase [Salmonella enterica subsp. enterica]EDW0613236.1 2-aminoethylphosphonate--pyruvate transaminase [Salmonella enterica subsp. enterica serovar Ball